MSIYRFRYLPQRATKKNIPFTKNILILPFLAFHPYFTLISPMLNHISIIFHLNSLITLILFISPIFHSFHPHFNPIPPISLTFYLYFSHIPLICPLFYPYSCPIISIFTPYSSHFNHFTHIILIFHLYSTNFTYISSEMRNNH